MHSRDCGHLVSRTDAAAVWASHMGCLMKVDTVHSSLLTGCVVLVSKREGKRDSSNSPSLVGDQKKPILVFFSLLLAPVPGPRVRLLPLLRRPCCLLPRTGWAAWMLPLCQDGAFPCSPCQEVPRRCWVLGRVCGGGCKRLCGALGCCCWV